MTRVFVTQPSPAMSSPAGYALVCGLRCAALTALLLLAGCSSEEPSRTADRGGVTAPSGTYKVGRPYQVAGRWYRPAYDPSYDQVGTGSWYGEQFQGRLTANGEIFDKALVSAAHPTLPLPSIVRVTNLENGRSVDLRVNDRGPFVDDREIDLSEAAAQRLGYRGKGLARVRVQFLRIAPDALGAPAPEPEPEVMVASADPALPGSDTVANEYARATSERSMTARRDKAAPYRATTVEVREAIEASSVEAHCASRGDPLFVQVGAFSDLSRAEHSRRSVAGLGPARLEPVFVRGEALLRLRVGPEIDPRRAQALLAKVKTAGHPQAFLTEAGPSKPTAVCRT